MKQFQVGLRIVFGLLASVFVVNTALAAESWNGKGHMPKIYIPADRSIKSFLLAGTVLPGEASRIIGYCQNASNWVPGWRVSPVVLKNNEWMKITVYESADCNVFDKSRREKRVMVPGNDGLDYIWIKL